MTETGGRILLVDDEADFRAALAARLRLRGLDVLEAGDGAEAVRIVRADAGLEAVVLDLQMPGMSGEEAAGLIKRFRPELPLVIMTGHGSVESAMDMGGRGAFRYLEKPVDLAELLDVVATARREKVHAMARQDMPTARPRGWRSWLVGGANMRPGVILLGLLILAVSALAPPSRGLVDLLSTPKDRTVTSDPIAGYPDFREIREGGVIADHYVHHYRPAGIVEGEEAVAEKAARKASVMIGLIVVAALFWATGAVPIGITAFIVAVVMYAFGVMRPDAIAQSFAKDAVIFIFGVLVFSRVIAGTGLDRRIAMLLLAPVRNLPLLLFVFLPLFAMTCSFVSESVLIALMMPLFFMIYTRSLEREGLAENRALLVMFALMLCYASNLGGTGSPAAGGRNAVMIGILADYDLAPSFLTWMKYGLPFVPVAALVLACYFFVVFRGRIKVRRLDVARIARESSERIGPLNREERVTAVVFLLVIALWVFGGHRLGMGGPVILGLVLLNVFGVMKWTEITRIHWDVVFLYAGASALGKGLAVTGGALYLASGFVSWLPDAVLEGVGLPMAVSFMTGLVTNIMSDGATVSAVGPIVVPMAQSAGLHPWVIGFATAFASSFPHLLIIGTPANALVYAMCKDPVTGEQLVTQKDFLKHGAVVFVLSFVVLWFWTFLGYWRWLGFPDA